MKLSRRVFPGLDSYSLGRLAGSLGIRFKSSAHRAEADSEVAAAVLLHIASHLGERYAIRSIDPQLLLQMNKLSAAKVPALLEKTFLPAVSTSVNQSKVKKIKNLTSLQKFRHYKGGIYELVCEATQESDLSPVIVYRAHNGIIWTRPKSVFFEMVNVEGVHVPRFAAFDE